MSGHYNISRAIPAPIPPPMEQNAEETACKPSSSESLINSYRKSCAGNIDLVLNFKDLVHMLLASFNIQKALSSQPSEGALVHSKLNCSDLDLIGHSKKRATRNEFSICFYQLKI